MFLKKLLKGSSNSTRPRGATFNGIYTGGDNLSGSSEQNYNNSLTTSTKQTNRQTLLLKSMEYINGSSTYYGNYMDYFDIPVQLFVGGEQSEIYPMLSYNQSLKSLILDFNKITEIPDCITLLPNLNHLSLAANQLTHVPEFLSQLKSLETFEIGINQFTCFPLNVCKIKSLTSLHLETNNIKSLPEEFLNLVNLKDLSLFDNQLKEIPDSLPNNIEKLNLGCNDISSSKSDSLIRISHSLTTLNLSENKIEELDESLSCLVNVKTLMLDCNMIKVIPGSVLGSWKSLVTLNLPHNLISDLPPEVILLSNLRIIDLRGNNFENCKKLIPTESSTPISFKIEDFIQNKERINSLKFDNIEILPTTNSIINSNNNNYEVITTTATTKNIIENKEDNDEKLLNNSTISIVLDSNNKSENNEINENNQLLTTDDDYNTDKNDSFTESEDIIKKIQIELDSIEIQQKQLLLKQIKLKEKMKKEKNKLFKFQQQEIIHQEQLPQSKPENEKLTNIPEQQQKQQQQQQQQEVQQPIITLTKSTSSKVEVEMIVPNQLIFWQSIVPDLIIDKLYLGCRECAMNKSWLKDNNVTHILTVANFKPLYPDLFKYLIINIEDVDEANIYQHFKEMNAFIDEGREKGGVLIHCRAGVSRSASATMAFIMMKNSLKFQEAFDITIKGRPRIYPNIGFINQLKKFEKDLFK
ncbi:leucine-rich repeat-containing protein [Dictyostelium discoideum AX4]|uniref:MAP kinase phosphatase with leucine-rich repeats protein 2 n=1 Tax=Dictyostelium discoideum TaxID=44689 RepID=MPL2_DICDI|nr:leucine-rich repeat-containing protein [Dictyostelium discoideum AX4]Q55CS8.2 RecName: Full=MAP kinase phosphatase with leucine-rich repeats protein 2 [Dictyostelium discoideum]EAL72694.2 leucine-rich repeat-containing protein [Dictyostelium discoideum AX4]|eukprot:XP_646403.2 leucine-rich repeat-containing protein [Dictyostelium discoideum AX4]